MHLAFLKCFFFFPSPTRSTDPLDFRLVQKPPTSQAELVQPNIISDTSSIVTRGTKGPAGDTVGCFCTEHIFEGRGEAVNMTGGLPSPCHIPCALSRGGNAGSAEWEQCTVPQLGCTRLPLALLCSLHSPYSRNRDCDSLPQAGAEPGLGR